MVQPRHILSQQDNPSETGRFRDVGRSLGQTRDADRLSCSRDNGGEVTVATSNKAPGVAIVTGAAGGMGQACAARLAEQGWALVLCDLREPGLEAVRSQVGGQAASVDLLAGDIADPAFPTKLLGVVGGRPIGALIHTAGLSPTMGDAERIMSVNYDATVRLVDAVRPKMAAGGCAVLIASSSAYMISSPEVDAAINALKSGEESASLRPLTASGPEAAYPISKRAVIRLAAREAAAFGERGARIVSISPGLIDTGMGRAEAEKHPQMQVMLERTPLKRLGEADEIATAAVFLCSPAASFISGIDILVDGGMIAGIGKLPGQG